MAHLFGTDGVRGVANIDVTGELAYKLGRAGAFYLTRNYKGSNKPVMLIGKDTRVSGDMLEAALVAGITSAGVDVKKLGIIPTPGVSYLTDSLDVQGGVMISASHNPIADNGIKFFGNRGYKLTDEMEDEIEGLITEKYEDIPSPTHKRIGIVDESPNLLEKYIDHLVNSVAEDLSGLKIVLDCANGAAYYTAPEVLKRLGAELIVINDHPDGEKINVNSGSTYPEVVKKEVISSEADFGIAHDGDADRIVMVDEEGNILDGDKLMAILAIDMLNRDQLKNKTVVTTRYSNLGLRELLENNGANMVTTKNGDRYVLREMLEHDYNLGGEKSGHIILLDYNKTGDGVLTGIQIAQIVKRSDNSLAGLADIMNPWPQKLANVEVKHKEQLNDCRKIREIIQQAEAAFGNKGRVYIRASGTEPVVRIMLEGKEEELLNVWEQKLTETVARELN